MHTRKYYCDILGVEENASLDEIRKAYFKLSNLYHPDKNKSTDAEEKFKEINNAYEALKNNNYSTYSNSNNEEFNYYNYESEYDEEDTYDESKYSDNYDNKDNEEYNHQNYDENEYDNEQDEGDYVIYVSSFAEENYWINIKNNYEKYDYNKNVKLYLKFELSKDSKKFNENYWGYDDLHFNQFSIFNLVPESVFNSIVNKDKTFGLYYLDFYKYLDLDQVYIPYENENGYLFPFLQFLNIKFNIFTPPYDLIPKIFLAKIKDVHLFRNDLKLYDWLNKLYEICKKIYSNYEYARKQYHLEILPLYIKPIDVPIATLEELKYGDLEEYNEYLKNPDRKIDEYYPYKNQKDIINYSWYHNYIHSMLDINIKFYNGKVINLDKMKDKLIALEESVKNEHDSWSNWRLLWNCKQLKIILKNEKMLYQYLNFAFDDINVSQTNNVVILTVDKELYSFNLLTKNKVSLYSSPSYSNSSSKTWQIIIYVLLSIIASILGVVLPLILT